MGSIYEGRELGRALRSHAASFTNVTSVPAEMTQTGAEPTLSIEAGPALLHSAQRPHQRLPPCGGGAGCPVHLEFGEEDIRLSVRTTGPASRRLRGAGSRLREHEE